MSRITSRNLFTIEFTLESVLSTLDIADRSKKVYKDQELKQSEPESSPQYQNGK